MTTVNFDDDLTMPLDGETNLDEPVASKSGHFPITVESRFKYVSQLGRGGSGLVYQAFDNKLQRYVALKFLLNPLPSQQQRLVTEARAQANVEHPNICPIYEVLETQEGAYLVMQYLEGQTLQQLAPELPLEQLLLIFKNVALGLQAAHKQGLNHRDLKPANIVVTKSAAEYTPIIVDFGLAANVENDNNQSFVGTRGFVAPELMLNNSNKIDRRSDLFSFGASLFLCVTGKNFDLDDSSDVFSQLRDNALPKDVQHIINQSLQPDPDLRYQSAQAVAKDIKNYLAGDPISARTGKGYWLKRKISKHKGLVAVVTIAVISLLTMYSKQIYERHQQSLREQALIAFNSQLKELEYEAQLTYLSPRHNIEHKQQHWLAQTAKLESSLESIDSVLLGATHYAIGRMYQILNKPDQALPHLEKAHAIENTSETAFYLSISYGQTYERQLNHLRNISDKNVRASRIAALEDRYKRPSIELLQTGLSSAPYQSYALALIAYYEQKWEQAKSHLKNSDELPNWLYQDELLMGNILYAQAIAQHEVGESYSTISPLIEQAENYFQQAITIAPSNANVSLMALNTYALRVRLLNQAGYEIDNAIISHARQVKEQTLAIDNNYIEAFIRNGQLLELIGLNKHYNSGGGESWFYQAEQDLLHAKQLSTKQDTVSFALAKLYNAMFKVFNESNKDANFLIDKAVEELNNVSEPARDYHYYNQLATLNRNQALTFQSQNNKEESQHYFSSAVKYYQAANQVNSDNVGSLINAASTIRLMAQDYELDNKMSAFQKAGQTLLHVLEKEPDHFVANYYLAVIYVDLYELNIFKGLTNYQVSTDARRQLDKLIDINNAHPYVLALNQKFLKLVAEDEFSASRQWTVKFDDTISQGLKLIEQFPENPLLLQNYVGQTINYAHIGLLLGLPNKGYVEQLENIILTRPSFANKEAYLAMVEVFKNWQQLENVSPALINEFQLEKKSSFTHRWARGIVYIATARSQSEIDRGIEILKNNVGLLPAYTDLLVKWAEQRAQHLSKTY